MKKLLTTICIIISLQSFAQDSVKITITPQVRDLEYIASFAYNDNALENFFDSVKVKFRVQNPPTGNTTVSFTAYTQDWLLIIQKLKHSDIALNANCASRIETLLRAVNQSYLTGKLDESDVDITNSFQSFRTFGRSRLRRQ